MNNDISQHIDELFTALAILKQPEKVRRLLLRLCTEAELAELGLRFQADAMIRRRLPLDEILNHFPGRADAVARVLMHQSECVRKTYFPKKKSNK